MKNITVNDVIKMAMSTQGSNEQRAALWAMNQKDVKETITQEIVGITNTVDAVYSRTIFNKNLVLRYIEKLNELNDENFKE